MNYENIKIDSQKYKKMSGINKLKLVRFKLDELFNEDGKHLITVIYNGERKQINKSKIGYFKNLVEREKKLEKTLTHTNLNTKKEDSFNFLKAYVQKEFNTDSFKKAKYEEKLKYIKERKDYFHKSIKENGNSSEVMEVLDYLEDLRIKTDIERISGKVEEKVETKKKEKKSIKSIILGLPFISKFKNKINDNIVSRNIKKYKTRFAAAALAAVIAFTGLSGLKSCNNKGNDVNTKTSITSVNKKDDIDNTINEIVETAKPEKELEETIKEESTIEDNDINLNDTVTVLDNSSIYTNSYDASYEINPCNALYDGSYDRCVEGLSYELDGKVYTIYSSDDNAKEKVDMLVKSGAKLSAVLLTRNDLVNGVTHEGYYNVDNVRVRVR